VREALLEHPRTMLKAFGVYMCVTMPFYLVSIYFTSFTAKQLGRSMSEAFTLNILNMTAQLIAAFFAARVSDRVGRKKVMTASALAILLTIYPVFLLMHQPSLLAIAVAQMVLAALVGCYIAPVPALLVEMFPTRIRYSGMALSYNLCAALIGGTTPMVCEFLVNRTGSYHSIALYVAFCALASLTALACYHDRWREAL
jgi:MHS family proline/betaine transporter-like MFS transporter